MWIENEYMSKLIGDISIRYKKIGYISSRLWANKNGVKHSIDELSAKINEYEEHYLGMYYHDIDRICINLKKNMVDHPDDFIWSVCDTISHEVIHRVLQYEHSEDISRKFDNISRILSDENYFCEKGDD